MRPWVKILALALLLLFVTGCGSAPVAKQPESVSKVAPAAGATGDAFAMLRQDADKFLKAGRPLYISAAEVYSKVVAGSAPGFLIVDVRSDEHYAKHHIPGSLHIAYADAWRSGKTDYLPRDRKIVVVDYSGHSSSQIVALWAMMGFDAVAMKHGMAGWSKDKEIIGGSSLPCEARNHPTVKDVVAAQSYALPVLDVKATNAADALRIRAEAVAAKPVVIQADDLWTKVQTNTAAVVDVRAPQHFAAGHIKGAVNIPLAKLAEEESLKRIPSDKPVVVVDYDGHASSQAARILNQLGYDATALRDGMSVWTGDAGVIGAPVVACAIPEQPTAQINAPLSPGPSTAAT